MLNNSTNTEAFEIIGNDDDDACSRAAGARGRRTSGRAFDVLAAAIASAVAGMPEELSLTATDQAAFEPLEGRRMMSAGHDATAGAASAVWFRHGVLHVSGSADSGNALAVNISADGTQVWGVSNNTSGEKIDASRVRQIRIIGGEENDTVNVDPRITIPVYIEQADANNTSSSGGAGVGAEHLLVSEANLPAARQQYRNELAEYQHELRDYQRAAGAAGKFSALSGRLMLMSPPPNAPVAPQAVTGTGDQPDPTPTPAPTPVPTPVPGDSGDPTPTPTPTPTPLPQPTPQPVLGTTRFTLINADTNQPIAGFENLSGSATIDLAKLPTRHLNVRADTTGASGVIGSVRYALDSNANYSTENAAPFALGGDNNGDYNAMTLSKGTHTIIATAWSADNAGGTKLGAGSLTLVVKDSAVATPNPAPQPSPDPTPLPDPTPEPTPDPSPNPDGGPTVDGAAITALEQGIQAGHAFHVSALSSQLKTGTILTAKFEWDFGDAGSKYNKLTGFNAAHLYENAGTYTIKLKITDQAGNVSLASRTLTVAASSRKVIYVSSSGGSDSNSGLSPQSAIKTFNKAKAMLGNGSNVEVLFKRGDTFDWSSAMQIGASNIVVGAYGDDNAAKPVMNYTGPKQYAVTFGMSSGAKDVTVRDLAFDSVWGGALGKDGMADGVSAKGTNIAVVDCLVKNVNTLVNSNGLPTGVLAQGNTSPSKGGLRSYLFWVQGTDQVYLGNQATNSAAEHILRCGGGERLNIQFNDFQNLDRRNDGVSWDIAKGTIVIHTAQDVYVANNTIHNGNMGFGPLGGADGLTKPDAITARSEWGVFENNHVYNAELMLENRSNHSMIRNNVFENSNFEAINVAGYSSAFHAGVNDVTITGNTGINSGTKGKFVYVGGSVGGITLTNNVYVATHLQPGNGSAAVYVNDSSLHSFRQIDGNLWGTGTPLAYTQGGYTLVGTSSTSASAYMSAGEWNGDSHVGNDYFGPVTLGSTYQATVGNITAGATLLKAA